MYDTHSNFAYGTVVTAPSPATTGTTIVIGTTYFDRFPDPGTSSAYNCVDWPTGTIPLNDNAEIVRVVGKATAGTLYISRNAESSGTRTIATGDQFAMNITAKTITDVENDLFLVSPATDHSSNGMKMRLVSTGSVNFGDVCYVGTGSQATMVDADAIASGIGLVMCADTLINTSGTGNWLLYGVARDDTWNWTVGGLIYITVTATTGNTLSQTAPTGTDDVVFPVGIALSADTMIFKPGLDAIERT